MGGRTGPVGDPALLDQLGEVVLVVVGFEAFDLGLDLGLEVLAAGPLGFAPFGDVGVVLRLPARLAALSIATWKRGWRTTLLDRRASLATTWAGMSRHQMIDSIGGIQAAPAMAWWMDVARSPNRGRVAAGHKASPRSRSAAAWARAVSSGSSLWAR